MIKQDFTLEERKLIEKLNTPGKVQRYLNNLEYNFEEDGETLNSFRKVILGKKAHCFEGALFVAAVLMQHNFPPLVVCMEARDLDHNIFLYKKDDKYGSVSKSRDKNLLGRPAKFKTIKDLVMSYYPYYWNLNTNNITDLTLRGYAKVDLRIFKQNWITNEQGLDFIVDHLYKVKYKKLFPRNNEDRFHLCGKDEKVISNK